MTVSVRRPRQRRGKGPPVFLNRAVLALLRSPLHGLLDAGMCELDYRGRRTGRAIALPVLYAPHDNNVVVLVGDAPDKRWWRNFAEPAPVSIRRGSQVRTGTARLVPPEDPAYAPAWAAYSRRHHIAHEPTDRLVLIETTRSAGSGPAPEAGTP